MTPPTRIDGGDDGRSRGGSRSGSRSSGPAMASLAKIVAERSDTMRFLRGNELAERGAVVSMIIERGRAQAVVRGASTTPYSVDVVSSAEGELPTLSSQLRTACTCPDWGDPCKHGVAVVLTLAERLDDDEELLARFIGVLRRSEPERLSAASTPATPLVLPLVPPVWAHEVEVRSAPHDAAEFFGDDPIPKIDRNVPSLGDEVVDALGPLMIDDLDIAPDIARLLRRLSGA
jgi:hypothetical protein